MGFKKILDGLIFDLTDEKGWYNGIITVRGLFFPDDITKWISKFKDMIKYKNKKETVLLILGSLADNESAFSHPDLIQFWEDCQICENKVSLSEFRNKFLDIPQLIFLEKNGNGENTLEYSDAIEKYPVEFVKHLKDVIDGFKDILFINQVTLALARSNKNESKNQSEQSIINIGTQNNYYLFKQNETKNFHELKNINLQSTSFTLPSLSNQNYETLQFQIDNVEKEVQKLQQSDEKRENEIDQLDQRLKHVEGSSSAYSPTIILERNHSLPHGEESIDSVVTEIVPEGIDSLHNAEKSHYLSIIKNSTNSFECMWKINDFDSLKSHPIKMRESDHFYTSKRGYKMCLRIYANGNDEEGRGTHLSVLYAVMKGDNDDTLDWPFSGVVTLTLWDYKKKKHFSKEFAKCEYPECYKRPSEEYNEAYGDRTFYPLKDLSPESRYLSNGSIFLGMSIEMK